MRQTLTRDDVDKRRLDSCCLESVGGCVVVMNQRREKRNQASNTPTERLSRVECKQNTST